MVTCRKLVQLPCLFFFQCKLHLELVALAGNAGNMREIRIYTPQFQMHLYFVYTFQNVGTSQPNFLQAL